MDLDRLWQLTLNEVEAQISRANFYTWLKNSKLLEQREGLFVISLPNNFAKEWVENKYQKLLLGIIREHDYSVKKLEFVVGGFNQEEVFPGKNQTKELAGLENRMNLEFKINPETNLNPKCSAKSFIVGATNELAHSAATAIIHEVGSKYNPFFVYGGVGLGKTHLIQMIGNEISSVYGGEKKARYVSSPNITS